MTKKEIKESLKNKMILELTRQLIEKDKVIKYLKQVVNKQKNFKIIYRDYLKSKEWNNIRQKVLNRDKYKCKCGCKASQVHHLTYDHIFEENDFLDDLISVCKICHKKYHNI